MRYQFIGDHRDEFPIVRMCNVLGVLRSGYYAWQKRSVSAREMANRGLVKRIREVYQASQETYGSPRIWRELREQGISCSENRVARLMKKHSIQAKSRRTYKVTTKRKKSHPLAPNLLDRRFEAQKPDQVWLSDITYIPTREGWLYLAAVLDMCSRRIVGWAMSERITSGLTCQALQMGLQQRRPNAGLIHHSDQGAQYTAGRYRALLTSNGIRASMNAAGSCYDNAPMESFFGRLKSELVHHCIYRTRLEARASIFAYIEGFYNRRRRHSALDYLSPVAFEQLLLGANGA